MDRVTVPGEGGLERSSTQPHRPSWGRGRSQTACTVSSTIHLPHPHVLALLLVLLQVPGPMLVHLRVLVQAIMAPASTEEDIDNQTILRINATAKHAPP